MDVWEQTLAWGFLPDYDRKEAKEPSPATKLSSGLPAAPVGLLKNESAPFDLAAACVFAVLSKCEGDDAVVVVDTAGRGAPTAILNPFSSLGESPFADAVAQVSKDRKGAPASGVRSKLADSVAQRAKTTTTSAASNAMVGTTAVLTKTTFDEIGDLAAVHAFDVLFVVHATADSMKVNFVYNKSLFSDATATDRLELFEMIYKAVVSGGAETTLRSIPNVTPRMLDRLLSDWQQERVPFSEYSRTLPDVFIETAQTRCNAQQQVAVLEPSTGRTITYHDMLVRARKLARYLHAKHPDAAWGVDATCGIHVPRCLDWYVMMLGIHLAGGAYLSLDPDFPGDRLLYCLEDSGAVCLFTIRRMHGSLGFKGPTHVIDELWDEIDAMDDTEEFVSPATALSPAYLIYTSGSTGKPKGVCIEHRNAVNFVESERRLYGLDNTHRVLQGFSTSFDASVEELWMAFANGGMLIVVEKAVMQDVELLGKLVEATKATILSTVPTLLATIDANYLRTLELVIAGGEACNKEVVAAYATGGKRRFVNSYGPTEATVACMADYSTPDRPVTIGRPQPGYFACIVNSRMELVPPGVPGELCMAGPSVARGYVNRPELTAEKFAHCPYVSKWREPFPEYDDQTANDETYHRLYHTGDLTRWNHEGRVEFLGRIDSQVKLRGFRIEVGEIETNLAAYPGVRTAIVHLLDEGGKQYLCGYLMCDDELKANFVEHKFRDFLKDKLPSYMIPSRFCTLDVVPRSPAGKLDRKQLKPPPPLAQVEDEGTEKVAPTTETEFMLHRLWSELFPGQRIGTTDDFFQIGGHSLLAGKLASKIRLAGYPDFGIRLVYSNATILALAAVVDAMTKEEPALPLTAGGRAQPTAVKLPDRFQPGWTRKILFGMYQFLIFTMAVALQWAYLLFFFFLYYGSQHDAVADLVQGRGAAFYIFFGIVMQFFFIATNFVLAFIFAPLLKWLLLQRVRPGKHSIWSVYFLRWWTYRTIHHLVAPTGFILYGTYLYNMQLTLLGAKLGSSCTILTALMDPDLIEIGDDCFVGDNVTLGSSQVIDSMLVLNKVTIGNCCSIGARSSIVGGAIIEDEVVLGPLSLVRDGVVIPSGEKWQGSPAQKVGYVPRLGQMQSIEGDSTQLKNNGWSPIDAPVNDYGGVDTELLEGMSIRLPGFIRFLIGVLQFVFYFFLQLFVTNVIGILTFASWIICDELASRDELWYAAVYILMAPVLTGLIMFYQHLMIILLRWIVFPWSPKPGMYPCDGLMFHRKILIDMLARVSLQYAHPMYSTIFTQYFLRAMGVKVGRRVECSNLFGWTPGLTTIGNECFVADFVGVNPSDCFRGVLRLDHVSIGDRAFIGNGSVLMAGTNIGERALVGLTSCPVNHIGPGKTAIGSPAFEIPRRTSADSVDQDKTFNPTKMLIVRRTVWETFRTVMPATFITISAVFAYVVAAAIFYGDQTAILQERGNDRHFTYIGLVLLFIWGVMVFNVLLTIVTKWIIIGAHHAEENPLWSAGVWRAEFVVDVCTVVGNAGTINLFRGTPFLPWLFRLLGAKIGKNVYLDTLYLTEPDMVKLGDGCCVNLNATLQTHLFEDRVMKLDTMVVGDRVSIGSLSVVLYNTHIGSGSTIAPCSLVMKGEQLPRCTHWAGIPAQKSQAPAVMQDQANITFVAAPTAPDEPPRTANAIESNIQEGRRSRAASGAPGARNLADMARGLIAASTWLKGTSA